MQKRGMFWTLAIIAVAVLLLGSGVFYITISKEAVQLGSGNVSLNITYGASDNQTAQAPEVNLTRFDETLSIRENQSNLSFITS
ncbi:hypothetical protein HYZ97_02055 [Candidatus Pacearchaeota archaeon]|nr:hypothetical protein [Candidatus Pacearchaeota archaeon]